MISPRSGTAFVAASSLSSWTGWVVPRIMPLPGDESSSDTAAISINAATANHSIDPSLLSPKTGLKFHRFAPMQHSQKEDTETSTEESETKLEEGFEVDYKTESTVLDVYIYPPNEASNGTTDFTGPLHVKLHRDSQELVNKTLQRMAISINKQISKKLSPKGKKQRKSQKKQASNDAGDISIVKQSAGDTPWDVEALTNRQVWTEAITTPLQVNLPLENSTLSLKVDFCPPTILTVLSFLDFATRVFCHVPLVVEVQSLFTSHVVIDWYVDGQPVCSDRNSFTPEEAHIGKNVSVLITPIREGCDYGRGYEEAYQFQHKVEPLPENTVTKLRQGNIWTNPNRRAEAKDSSLRVLTYNILADQNAYYRGGSGKTIPFYLYVERSTLDKARRMPLLLHEILSYQADVICLQEVDESIWERLLRPALHQAGYQGFFSTKVAKGMKEGCALLWSLHRFESIPSESMKSYGLNDLIKETSSNPDVRWKSSADIASMLEQNPDVRSVIENKLGHVVQMASLPLIKTSQKQDGSAPDRILVANTHLFYHRYGAHFRLMQMYAICQQFERFRNEAHAAYPMILCGDMNSSLRRAAGYLLIHRHVASDHSQIREHFNTFEWRERGTAAPEAPPPAQPTVRVEHTEKDRNGGEKDWRDFPSVSLPDHFPSFLTGYPTEPKFTHYLDSFAGSLDHIFISLSSNENPHGLTPLRSAPMPSKEDATELVAMPSEKFPSDHVSLVADLEFTNA